MAKASGQASFVMDSVSSVTPVLGTSTDVQPSASEKTLKKQNNLQDLGHHSKGQNREIEWDYSN